MANDIREGDVVTLADGSYSRVMTDEGLKTEYGIAMNKNKYTVLSVDGKFPSSGPRSENMGNNVMMKECQGSKIVFTRACFLRVQKRFCSQCDGSQVVRAGDTVGIHDGSESLCLDDGKLIHIYGIDLNGPRRYEVVATNCALPSANCLKHPDDYTGRSNDVLLQQIGGLNRTVFINSDFLTVHKRKCPGCGQSVKLDRR